MTFLRKFLPIFFVALLSLTPLLWFKGKMIAGEEFYALDYGKWGDSFSYAWSDRINYGEASVLTPLRFQGLLFNLLAKLGLSSYLALIIWHSGISLFTGFGFYFLLKKIYGSSAKLLPVLIGTASYIYTPYFLNISPLLTPPKLVFAGLPFIFIALYDILKVPDFKWFYAFKLILITFLISPTFVNLPSGVILFLPIIILLIYKVLLEKDYLIFGKYIFCLVSFGLLLHGWWLYPTINRLVTSASTVKATSSDFSAIQASSVFDVITFFGSWAFREKIRGYDYNYFPYYKLFDSFPLGVLRYIPPFVILIGIYGLINKIKSNKNDATVSFLVYISFVFIFALFLSKGSSGIFGFVYTFLYENLPFFWIFREPYAKFLPLAVTTGAIFLTEGLNFIDLSIARKFSIPLSLAIFTAVIWIGFPFWTNQVIWKINDGDVRSYEVEMPDYWKDFIANWKYQDGYYLVFPANGWSTKYLWPSGYIGNPILSLTDGHIMNTTSGYILNPGAQEIIIYIYNKMFSDPKWLVDNASRYNIAGIIYQGDTSDNLAKKKGELIDTLYSKYKTQTFGPISVYDFGSTSNKFEILAKQQIIKFTGFEVGDYAEVRDVLPINQYILHQLDNKKAYATVLHRAIASDHENSYDLPDNILEKGTDYIASFDDPGLILQKILLDTHEIKFSTKDAQRYFEFKYEPLCCKKLFFEFDQKQKMTLGPDWLLFKQLSPGKYEGFVYKGNVLDLSDKNYLYYKSILGYNPREEYKLVLKGKTVSSDGISIMLLLRDTDVQDEVVVSGGTIDKIDGEIIAPLKPINFVNTAVHADYELLIRRPWPKPGQVISSENYFQIDDIAIYKDLDPKVVLMPKEMYQKDVSESKSQINYHQIAKSVYLLEIDNYYTRDYIQFKNSYDKNWRVIKINKNLYEKINKNKLQALVDFVILTNINKSEKPVNIEYYSNSWELKESDTNSYFIVYYLPEIVLKCLLALACFICLIACVAQLWNKRFR